MTRINPNNKRTRSGTVVLGRLVDAVDEPHAWDDPSGHSAREVGSTVSAVRAASPPGSVRTTNVGPTFVTAARERAEAAASASGTLMRRSVISASAASHLAGYDVFR
ncbi:hypothetical protein ACIP2Y_08155 [Streptomyces sviceus]|uniref:hypothetical protein n=1 Tax=Streptomyces sviceus TaxID=285530 RepID=UPI003805FC84